MKVHAVHVDRVYCDGGPGMTESVRYEFDEPTWVSAHRGRDGERVGPLTVLSEFEEEGLGDTEVVRFEPYALPTGDGGDDEDYPEHVSYRDTWTIPRGTVYVLMLPREFVDDHVAVKNSGPGEDHYYSLDEEVTPEGNLFYRTVVEFSGTVNVQARLRHDPVGWEAELEAVGVVDPPVDHGPVDLVREKAPSSNFFLLLLELRKLFGSP